MVSGGDTHEVLKPPDPLAPGSGREAKDVEGPQGVFLDPSMPKMNGHRRDDQEDNEQGLGDSGRGARKTAEPEQRRDESQHEKTHCPA
jgi:hypothetical protein